MSCARVDSFWSLQGGEMKKNHSKFIEEITSLPFIQSAATLYSAAKEKNRVIKLTLKQLEFSCTKAIGFLHNALPPNLESAMDDKAARCVSYAKGKYPDIQKTPREIYSDGRSKVMSTMRNAAKAFARSRPGQTVIRGIDWSIETGENLLEYLDDRDSSEEHIRHRTRRRDQLEKGKERHYASSDSGVNSEMKDRSSDLVRHRGQTLDVANNSEEKEVLSSSAQISSKIYHVVVVLPVQLLVAILRPIQHFLYTTGGRRVRRRRNAAAKFKLLTPEKVAEIDSRRKVSPRKRVKRSFFGTLKYAAFGIVGFRSRCFLPLSTRESTDDSVSPKMSEGEKKRKYQDTETEQDTESEKGSESDGFQDLDLQDYNSEEDPDYVPSEASEDSLEYQEGETDEVHTTEEEQKEEEGKVDRVEEEENELDDKVNASVEKEKLEPKVLGVKRDTGHVDVHEMHADDETTKKINDDDDDVVHISMDNIDNSKPRIKSPAIRLAPAWKVE